MADDLTVMLEATEVTPAEAMIREAGDSRIGCSEYELVRISEATSGVPHEDCYRVFWALCSAGVLVAAPKGSDWEGRWFLAPWFVNSVRGDWFGLMDGDPADPHLPPWVAPEWASDDPRCSSHGVIIG